jgi:hypothetical protein
MALIREPDRSRGAGIQRAVIELTQQVFGCFSIIRAERLEKQKARKQFPAQI